MATEVVTLPDDDEIAEIFLPYVQKEMFYDDSFVRHQLRSDARKFFLDRVRTELHRFSKGWRRRQEDVQKQYDRSWSEMNWSALDNDSKQKHLMRWHEKYYLGNAQVIGRVHISFLERMIKHIRPSRVLEVGSGRGMILILLAERFPEIEFSGLDLSPSGVKRAQELDAQGSLPAELVRFAPYALSAQRPPGRVQFVQGTATSLPFTKGHFDFVYTHQALEQMEPYRYQVFSEIRRVCGGHAAFFEPFRDWNESGTCRNRIVAKDYFAARISDLSGYGFEPIICRNDLPVKTYMNIGMVLSKCIEQ